MRTFEETVDYLYSMLPMFQRQGAPALRKMDLAKITALSARLGNPHQRFPSLHVAGTNGKGSVCAMLSAVLQAAGYESVGLYTSPHLKHFNERVRLNGVPAPRAWIVGFVEKHEELIEAEQPSFFELTCLMAFQFFAEQEVDFALIEVGLGGRLDSTNIITPLVSAITSIGFDHKDILGDTLPEIAGEKAGIIKPGVPVVVGDAQEETRPVFEEVARKHAAPLAFAHERYALRSAENDLKTAKYQVFYRNEFLFDLECGLTGAYQAQNIATVLQTIDALNTRIEVERALPKPVSRAAVLTGLRDVRKLSGIRGRMDVWQERPLALADVGHNPAALRQIFRQVLARQHEAFRVVLGAVVEKDLGEMIAELPRDAQYYCCRPDVPRGLPAEQLLAVLEAAGRTGAAYENAAAAYAAALADSGENDLVLVTGSAFLVAELLPEEG